MAATLFGICVAVVLAGVIWFNVVRPILEDFGVISTGEAVNPSPVVHVDAMSRPAPAPASSALSSLGTDGRTAETTALPSKFTEDQLFTLYRYMRGLGAKRDDAREVFKAAGIPMNNGIWSRSAPPPIGTPAEDDDTMLTPIAGRPTRASFADPDLEYQPPPS